MVDLCSYNGEEVIPKFSGFCQAVCDHFFLRNVPELSDGLVFSNCLLDADDVGKESLVLTRFQVMDTAEEVLVISES